MLARPTGRQRTTEHPCLLGSGSLCRLTAASSLDLPRCVQISAVARWRRTQEISRQHQRLVSVFVRFHDIYLFTPLYLQHDLQAAGRYRYSKSTANRQQPPVEAAGYYYRKMGVLLSGVFLEARSGAVDSSTRGSARTRSQVAKAKQSKNEPSAGSCGCVCGCGCVWFSERSGS